MDEGDQARHLDVGRRRVGHVRKPAMQTRDVERVPAAEPRKRRRIARPAHHTLFALLLTLLAIVFTSTVVFKRPCGLPVASSTRSFVRIVVTAVLEAQIHPVDIQSVRSLESL